jgi:hypothetical protein
MYFILVALFIAYVTGCHPECRYACDDPICAAVCAPDCQPVNCSVVCVTGTCTPPGGLRCVIDCPADQCESDSCPACQPLCEEVPADCPPVCETHCQPPVCTWQCRKPTDCPQPRCELVCERPACESSNVYTGAGWQLGWNMLVTIVLLTVSVVLY